MKRERERLLTTRFDIVIIGGGIHGAVLAMEAARAGYTVALLEKGDFGHATSANSLKIIHGGIRYLQHGDFKRMRESIVSRRAMMSFAPHLVKPLACLMPTYGHGVRGREMMRLAFGIYDLVAFDRNRGLIRENHLPAGTSLSVDECRWIVPGIDEENLTGGAVWYDAIAENSERLTLEYVRESAKYGGCMANYMEVLSLEKNGNQLCGLRVRDLLNNSEFTLSCSLAVNACGPQVGLLSGTESGVAGQKWAAAINIIVKKKLFKRYGVGLEGYTDYVDRDAVIKRGKRLFFFVPWRKEYTMIGTAYKPWTGPADQFSLGGEDINEVLLEINKIYPPGKLSMDDVTFFHGGILPMKEADTQKPDSVQLNKSSEVLFHGKEGGVKGLITIKGVKYTTAPDIAGRVLAGIRRLKMLPEKTEAAYRVSRKRPRTDFGPLIRELGEEYIEIRSHLQSVYGSAWRDVFAFLVERGGFRDGRVQRVSDNPLLLEAEVLYFIAEEMAVNLADVVFRRSCLGSAECPPPHVLQNLARIMGRVLDWTKEEEASQIAQVERCYVTWNKS
ncbi:glycerol-3-phosphate dehydrogenase/oxidase [Desulfomarina sp.]